MCTLTLLPLPNGLRMACNRDEQRSRATALPPDVFRCGERLAIFPIDPDSGGTWIAAADSGLGFALLNIHRSLANPRAAAAKVSRGRIIPALISCGSLDDVVLQVMLLAPTDYQPFRLVVVDGRELVEVVSGGEYLTPLRRPVPREPVCFTSSGLGDEIAAGPRAELFREFFAQPSDWRASRQRAFHRHTWADRRDISVCMSRADACTVSFTTVELTPAVVRLSYHAGPPDQPAATSTRSLPVRAATTRSV